MSAAPCPALDLLVELARRGIEVRAAGDRLRYRPRSAMTSCLAERMTALKGELLAILMAAEVRPFKSAARDEAARLIRDARRGDDRDRAVALRDAWRERLAICTIDGGLPLTDAETVALDDLQNLVVLQSSIV